MPTPTFDTSAPVLVTGATGYLAGWIVKRLLEEGFTVHAPVRNPDDTVKLRPLTDVAGRTEGSIRFFKADLLDEGSYDEAMKGCAVVMHTASPFTSRITDPQRDLVDPALRGTQNVLNAANRTRGVRRVVLTSSCAAIYGDVADVARAGGTLTEADWNTTSSLDHSAYSYSKTVAEKAAWEIAKAQSEWDLVVVNPALILGPALGPAPTSESFSLVRQLVDGTMAAGAPHLEIGCVDVRDVAEAHLNAAFIEAAQGRNITFASAHSFLELGQMVAQTFPGAYKTPKRTLPKWLLLLAGPMVDKALTRKWVRANIGHAWAADNSKGKRDLGMTYRPVADALRDMILNMAESGAIRPPA